MKEQEQENIIEQESEEVIKQEVEEIANLIIYNDDINTFDYVIYLLQTICKLDSINAEQCTIISHYTGKCIVKKGKFVKMKNLMEQLIERGLEASVDKT
jgi:ATP-dependent Clp protease adaptor protein ClpS